jgi:hypothetical protein
MTNKKTYKVELNIETMQDIIDVFEHYSKQPCRKKVIWELPRKLRNIIQHGCFVHNLICETFKVSYNESITICSKCSPKKYKKLKDDFQKK